MRFAILGSGFGLYGYLPALAGLGHSVVLPRRYHDVFYARRELLGFAEQIEWEPDETAALVSAAGVVIALRPEDQRQQVLRTLTFPGISRLLLEKPLAPTPGEGMELHRLLALSGKAFRVGYTFCSLPWASLIRASANTSLDAEISISWRFLAHHFQHALSNWKHSTTSGGGAIRFYGIQLIALLAQSGYRFVSESRSLGPSETVITGWSATFSGDRLPICRVVVDCQSETAEFRIASRECAGIDTVLFQGRDPFGSAPRTSDASGIDGRVGILQDIARSLIDDAAVPVWYGEVLKLWQMVEDRTVFQGC